jgi:hypothetical protein
MELAQAPLAAALTLAAVYLLEGWLGGRPRVERVWRRRRWISAAAGVSVAYVFVDVLPELAAQNRAIDAALGEGDALFSEQRIYLLSLLAFVVLYGLEHMVLASRERRREMVEAGGNDAIYWLNLAGSAAYSALIGYLLVERAERGGASLVVYTIAMAVHFFIVAHSLGEAHGAVFRRTGRWVLAASVLAGWLAGAMAPLSEVMFARLFAVLAGGVVITSLRAELPDDRHGRFWPFLLGAAGFALLLLLT